MSQNTSEICILNLNTRIPKSGMVYLQGPQGEVTLKGVFPGRVTYLLVKFNRLVDMDTDWCLELTTGMPGTCAEEVFVSRSIGGHFELQGFYAFAGKQGPKPGDDTFFLPRSFQARLVKLDLWGKPVLDKPSVFDKGIVILRSGPVPSKAYADFSAENLAKKVKQQTNGALPIEIHRQATTIPEASNLSWGGYIFVSDRSAWVKRV